ncbi:MAG: hypothetical protein RX318_00010 [bacterium]|nr:hypothetical protein [bacterium]
MREHFSHLRGRFWPLAGLWGAAALAALLALPAPAYAQFDFADAFAVQIRTYPVKFKDGQMVPGPDGMPQPKGGSARRPAELTELPTFAIDASAPGAWMLDAFQHYMKQDPLAALAALLAVIENGYLEIEIDKRCSRDTARIAFEHIPTEGVPAFKEAGLAMLMKPLADAVMAAELQRESLALRDQYNTGLSKKPKADQKAIARLRVVRFAIGARYNPRVVHPALDGLHPFVAKQVFKAALANGEPLQATLVMGPIRLDMRAKVERRAKRPLPAGCQTARSKS